MIKLIDLQYKQNLPLDEKILLSRARIHEYYRYFSGNVFISFSGGKDSTVLLHLVRNLYPDVPAVFVNTGLEYPEIKEFVRSIENVTWLRPTRSFNQVLNEFGYPVISKAQSKFISEVQNRSQTNQQTVSLRLTGFNSKGEKSPSMAIAKKWLFLIDLPIKISDKCCLYLKKKPIIEYQKISKRFPFIGTMAYESSMRRKVYLRNGCNILSKSYLRAKSQPLSFWTEDDIWQYIHLYALNYSSIYDLGEKRTGCMFCMFGVHLEKGQNRFQRMKESHPKHYRYCIEKLGIGRILDIIGVAK